MALAPGTLLGPYEVTALIGAGGMGAVYRARDPRLGREVAIKVLPEAIAADSDRLRRFAQEARAVAALNHPNILTVYDVGTAAGAPYVVTELLDGETWREVLARRAPRPGQMLALAAQAAEGLAAAHARGIVHRDLKPENLFLTTDGRVKILDFGLAKVLDLGLASQSVPGPHDPTRTAWAATQPNVLMGTLAYMAPEQVQAQAVDARADVFAFGVVLYEMLTGRHPFLRETPTATLSALLGETPPALAPSHPEIPPMVDVVLRRCLAKHREDRFTDARALAQGLDQLLHAARDATTLVDLEERSPYPGLRSFTEQDRAVFFGREDEVAALWTRIRARPLLAVIGPSGAGKTSFLRAGVVAGRPDGWAALVCTPGTAPLRALGQALAPQLTTDLEALRQLVAFDDPEVAVAVLGRWRRAHGDALVVVDQFEELFTNNPPEVQARVAALIGRLAGEADIHVVVSVRDDFLMRCHEYPALVSVFSEVTPLGALTPASLRLALVEPARKLAYRFEDETLVDEMIECVEGARAALPLLAFAVARVWEQRDREQRVLTRAAYEQIGGVAGALAQHAEATLDRIGSMQQDLVRELFRNLVTAQGTRAVMDRDELLSVFPGRPEAGVVLRDLVDARLLTSYEVKGHPGEPDRQRIEIVHESLIKAWPRLVRWQVQDEHGAQLRDQLKQAAHLWEEKGRTADLLWTGTAFREYAVWRERYPGSLTALEEDFARAMAARAQRRKRLQRAGVAAIILVLSVVALAIGVSRQQAARARDSATAAARRAEASKLLALAELRFADDPTEAALLAGSSLEQYDTPDARAFLMKVLWAGPLSFEVVEDQGVFIPAFSPDGRRLAAGGMRPIVRLWTDDGRGPFALSGLDGEGVLHFPMWASNDMLIVGPGGMLSTRVHVWSAQRRKRLRTIEFGAPTYWQVGAGRLLTESDSGPGRGAELRSWLLPHGEPVSLGHEDEPPYRGGPTFFAPDGGNLLYLKGPDVRARALPIGAASERLFDRLGTTLRTWSAESGRLVFGDENGSYHVWDYGASRGPTLRVLRMPNAAAVRTPDRAPNDTFPDSSGRWMVEAAQNDQQIRLWDLSSWAEARPQQLRRGGSWYASANNAHPSGEWVVASTSRATHLTFWPVRQPYARVVDVSASGWRPVVFSPDGKWLATSWGDGGLRLWPLPGTGTTTVRTLGLPEKMLYTGNGIAFDPAGRYVIATGFGGRVWMAPLDGSPPRRLEGFAEDATICGAAASPSGRRVAAAPCFGQGDKSLCVWDLQSRSVQRLELPPGTATGGYERGIQALAFSDESTLYSAGDGGLRQWDLDAGTQELLVPSRPEFHTAGGFSSNARLALLWEYAPARNQAGGRPVRVYDTRVRSLREVPTGIDLAAQPMMPVLDPSGSVMASGSESGIARVGRLDAPEPHILVGHKGAVAGVAISPDLRWVATTGEDNTLRLWPMPDLSKPPLHTLPLDELLAKLRSLTNLRAVRDPSSSTGWKIEVGPFPGWKNVPTW